MVGADSCEEVHDQGVTSAQTQGATPRSSFVTLLLLLLPLLLTSTLLMLS